jgi:hypothetical protein
LVAAFAVKHQLSFQQVELQSRLRPGHREPPPRRALQQVEMNAGNQALTASVEMQDHLDCVFDIDF